MEQIKVFISYVSQDRKAVNQLRERLTVAGYDTWIDWKNILPGEDWRRAIDRAISEASIFIICLSRHSLSRKGHVHKEISIALATANEKLTEDIYILPVRLEECPVPENLHHIQWVDLYGENNEEAWARLFQSLEAAKRQISLRREELKKLLQETEFAFLQIKDIPGLAETSSTLKSLPRESGYSPETQKRINKISELARDYQMRSLSIGKITLLTALRHEVTSFQKAMTLTSAPIGAK